MEIEKRVFVCPFLRKPIHKLRVTKFMHRLLFVMVSPLTRVRRPRSVIRWCRDHVRRTTACGCLHVVADGSAKRSLTLTSLLKKN